MASNSSEEDLASNSSESSDVPYSSDECVKPFAVEMLKCLLIDSRICWNPSWSFQIETSDSIDSIFIEVLEDLNFCREKISLSVNEASRRFHSIVREEVSDIWKHSSDPAFQLFPSLTAVTESKDCFFTCMAIAKDVYIRFYREEKSHVIADVLEAVVYLMREMVVFDPVRLRYSIEKFMMAATSSKDSFVSTKYFAEEMLKCLLTDSYIQWNPSWGFQIETSASTECVVRNVSEHLNTCHELISKCISIVNRKKHRVVDDEASYVFSHSSNKDMLPKSLIAVGEDNLCFFTFMAIANELCIRFHREGKSHLIADVLKAVVYFMENKRVSQPELFISQGSDFISRHGP